MRRSGCQGPHSTVTCSAYVRAFWPSRAASMLVRLSALAFWPLLLPSFWPRAFSKLCGRSSTQLSVLPIASSSLSSSFYGAAFAFCVVRFLAAPIAAPESAPITVPTTGKPSAVPATAPATAPPRVLPAVPVLHLYLCPYQSHLIFVVHVSLPELRNDARFCKSSCQHAAYLMHCVDRLG